MQVVIRKTERRIETLSGKSARIAEADVRRGRALLGDVPDDRYVLRLLRIGPGLDVGLDLREKVQRLKTLVVALDRVGVEHHARPLAQFAPDHLVVRSGISGDLDQRDARYVDVVLDVGRTGFQVDGRRIYAALEVTQLEMELRLVELLQRLVVGVAHGVGVDASRF